MQAVTKKDLEAAADHCGRLQQKCEQDGALRIGDNDITDLSKRLAILTQQQVGALGVVGRWPISLQESYLWLAVRQRALSTRLGLEWYTTASICAAVGVVAILLPLLVFTTTIGTLALACVAGALAAFALGACLSLFPSEENLTRAVVLGQQLKNLRGRHTQVRRLTDLRYRYQESLSVYETLTERYRSRKNGLLLRDWRLLRGIDFERFLCEIFATLGYHVETTKASGDQGVDLIAVKADRRIAIQAKGYANNVSNKAVQEAFAGKVYYQCVECVVITNSSFTRSARDLAKATGCYLVSGTQIEDLILGKLF